MDENIASRLTHFISKWATSKKPKIDHFILVHVANGTDVQDTVYVDEDFEPRQVAESMFESAQSHAESLGSGQRYAVAAMDGPNRPIAKEWFRCNTVDLVGGFTTQETEPPTTKGQLKMGMRHLEVAMQMAMKLLRDQAVSQEQNRKTLVDELMQLRAQQASLTGRYLELTGLLEQAKSEQQARELDQMQTLCGEERKQWLFGWVKQHGPMLVSSLTGATPLARFVAGLDDETKAQMMCMLPEEKQKELAGLLQIAEKAKMSLDALENPPGGGNGQS